jgi:hypothetical protein
MNHIRTTLVAVLFCLMNPATVLADPVCEAESSSLSECSTNPNSTLCQMLLSGDDETEASINAFIDSIKSLDEEMRERLICARLLGKEVSGIQNTWTLERTDETTNNIWAVYTQNMEQPKGTMSFERFDQYRASRYEIHFDFIWKWEEVLALLNELEELGYPLDRKFDMVFYGRIIGLWSQMGPENKNLTGLYIQVEVDRWSVSTEWASSKDKVLPTLYQKRAEAYQHYMEVRD